MLCWDMSDFSESISGATVPRAGALGAVAARHQANRRTMILTGLYTLALAVLAIASLLGPDTFSGGRRDWLPFVTLPSGLLLLWVGGRFALCLMNDMALRRDRRDIERLLQTDANARQRR